jgi:hypothetical protein
MAACWKELCEEERERALEFLEEAGREAARDLFAGGRLDRSGTLNACLAAYQQTLTHALAGRTPPAGVTRQDLRAAAFCVAFDDERRSLQNLPPASRQVHSLLMEVNQARRSYSLLGGVLPGRETSSPRQQTRDGQVLPQSVVESPEVLEQAADQVVLTTMRFDLALRRQDGGHRLVSGRTWRRSRRPSAPGSMADSRNRAKPGHPLQPPG